jgi:hypothetical protein
MEEQNAFVVLLYSYHFGIVVSDEYVEESVETTLLIIAYCIRNQ